jgi:hypothetical protein
VEREEKVCAPRFWSEPPEHRSSLSGRAIGQLHFQQGWTEMPLRPQWTAEQVLGGWAWVEITIDGCTQPWGLPVT